DRTLLSVGNPYPAQIGWRESGTVKRLRFDPLEVFQATSFGVDDVKLCADNTPANNRYTISWISNDPDSPSLNIGLFYGSLSGGNFVGAPIATVTNAPGSASYVWDTSGVRAGSYYIQAVVSDGTNTLTRTSRVPVVVTGDAAGYFSLTNASALAADFDGDGLADPALYQESTGSWQIKLSGGSYTLVDLPGFSGGAGYSALAADFDGDGKADPAIYQAATGNWLVKLSGSGYFSLNMPGFLGGEGYEALVADFDGDRLADPAVYSVASGAWIIRLSSAEYIEILLMPGFLGGVGYSALTADFDGDGKADPAVYQTAAGNWQVRLSGSEYVRISLPDFLGGEGYEALVADFDGDGLADPAVYHSATGIWRIKLSTGGYATVLLVL
ncbi:MAG: VCBS repeat-containing protein, partial [Kiritimatiellia bacterium]|nr:VCBS repeat-containing protein [Kiritimatiellia bacterium]